MSFKLLGDESNGEKYFCRAQMKSAWLFFFEQVEENCGVTRKLTVGDCWRDFDFQLLKIGELGC